ncbi:MAG TPA: SDR family NAD(P)-dependent oxidoreductase, partial [Marmoricola sp.]|nr:SDR family NAD(P)-dependent oxidoreductase [Marmoricola sp.]
MSLELGLDGQVALITGGVRGVGLGITRQFVAAGAHVVTCARSEADPIPGTTHIQCDVRDPEAVAAMIEQITSTHGHLDVLVNNAGGAPFAMAADASPNFHDKITGLNLLSPLLLMQAANRVMQAQESGGAIVNIS